jgi:hypothetical protein
LSTLSHQLADFTQSISVRGWANIIRNLNPMTCLQYIAQSCSAFCVRVLHYNLNAHEESYDSRSQEFHIILRLTPLSYL